MGVDVEGVRGGLPPVGGQGENPAHAGVDGGLVQPTVADGGETWASVPPPLPGISRSMPAATPPTRSLTAPQSDTTAPVKPHSSRSSSVSSQGCWEA